MSRALAFLSGGARPDYGTRLARLRWRRAVGTGRSDDWDPAASAAVSISGAASWVVVLDAAALPVALAAPEPPPGRVLAAQTAVPEDPLFIHTLRELEGARLRPAGEAGSTEPAALAFRAADFPAVGDETVSIYIKRLLASSSVRATDPAFRVVRFGDPSDRERPELTRLLPGGPLRVLDAGCGGGAGISAAKARNPSWTVTGVEWDEALAGKARTRCDRVLEGDLARILPELSASGERFDAIVLADVLEHLADPVAALAAGLGVAAPGALLIVSVPNAGHLSIARDLVAGRFDPIPAGLTDARHLRWFTRATLAEALVEAGWRSVAIEGEPGAPSPDAAPFLEIAAAWPDCDRESLTTYQWIATAVA